MSKYPESIIDKELETCFICGTTQNIHIHHIFGGPNRKLSTKYGIVVALCARHHNMSNDGVHFNRTLDLKLKKHAQQKAMNKYGWDISEFVKIFGKSYL